MYTCNSSTDDPAVELVVRVLEDPLIHFQPFLDGVSTAILSFVLAGAEHSSHSASFSSVSTSKTKRSSLTLLFDSLRLRLVMDLLEFGRFSPQTHGLAYCAKGRVLVRDGSEGEVGQQDNC
jgi:hypothetical protein